MEDKARDSAIRQAVYERNYRRAKHRAMSRLARQFPEIYRQYLDEERRKDEEEGKTWLTIDPVTGVPVRRKPSYRNSDNATGYQDREPQSHNGGEA